MSGMFRAGAMELADEVARLHESGPGLPAAEIGARSRRLRRRREATLVVVTSAAVGAIALGGAALLDRGAVTPPAGPPSVERSVPATVGETDPVESPSSTPEPEVGSTVEPAPVESLGVADLDRIALDPAVLATALVGLGELKPWTTELALGDWGLDPAVVVYPEDACRPLLTVVTGAPSDYRVVGWSSGEASVSQEVVVLADERAAASAFDALGQAYQACPEYGASLPESSGAWHVVAALGVDQDGLPSFRASGSELGEGNENGMIQVDLLVSNVILRTEVYLYGVTSAGEADASAVAEVVERAVQAGLAAVG